MGFSDLKQPLHEKTGYNLKCLASNFLLLFEQVVINENQIFLRHRHELLWLFLFILRTEGWVQFVSVVTKYISGIVAFQILKPSQNLTPSPISLMDQSYNLLVERTVPLQMRSGMSEKSGDGRSPFHRGSGKHCRWKWFDCHLRPWRCPPCCEWALRWRTRQRWWPVCPLPGSQSRCFRYPVRTAGSLGCKSMQCD